MSKTIRITDAQIEALRTEAGAAGDSLQVALCDVALGREDRVRDSQIPAMERVGVVLERSDAADVARSLCERAIGAGAAQR